MKQFHVGVQLYSVRDDLAADFIGTLRKVKDMGYEYVEFAGYYGGYTGAQLKKLLDDIGLKSVSVHQNIDTFLTGGVAAFDFFKAYGVQYVVIPWYDAALLPGSDAWEETKEKFRRVSGMAKTCGMSILYHNHDFEFVKVGDRYKYDIMMEELLGYVDPQPDVCWIHYGGADPSAYIRKYADRIHVVHLKDFVCTKLASGPVYALIGDKGEDTKKASQADNGFCLVPLGDGRNDFAEILAACTDADADYVIVEQDNSTGRTPLEAIERSRNYLKTQFGL